MITKQIFLASSSELKEEREQFEIFVNRKNKEWKTKNIFFELIIWEDFLDAISQTRLQDEYNIAIQNCDIFILLFFTKVGKYSEEEFEKALRQFKETKRPFIFTYFKDAPILSSNLTDEILSLIQFKKKLDDLGHFYAVYKNVDELKFKFNEQLNKLFSNEFTKKNSVDEASLLELITKLTSQYSNLAKKPTESSAMLYKEIIEPALDDMEKVHENYLETFHTYKQMLEIPFKNPDHPLIKKIEDDRLYTMHLRSKLEALKEIENDNIFGSFIRSVNQYVNGGETMKRILVGGRPSLLNSYRSAAVVGLKQLFAQESTQDEKRKTASNLLDQIIEELQFSYQQVRRENIKLKNQFIK